jgi:hypothetical protein
MNVLRLVLSLIVLLTASGCLMFQSNDCLKRCAAGKDRCLLNAADNAQVEACDLQATKCVDQCSQR